MTGRNQVILGLATGLAAAWGARQWLRHHRRISLDGRVVIITGASSGHGLILARQAAEQGALLALAARDPGRLEAAAAELRRNGARAVLAVPTDVTSAAECEVLARHAIERLGRIDILVNNAGMIQVAPLAATTRADFETALNVNFWGAWNTIEAVLPFMRERGFGRIANISSLGGKMAVPHLAPYSASKFALTGLTRALRVELARENILVTGVYPGTMRTGGHDHAWIKGNQDLEYVWFALSDSLPGLAASADQVARATWRGLLQGDAEVRVGWPTHLGTTFDALLPNGSAEVLALANGLLPDAPMQPAPPRQGRDIPGLLPGVLSAIRPTSADPDPAP